MSRCVLDDESRRIQVVIGWDPGMQSFFARVWDRRLYDEQIRAGEPEHTAGLRLWTGGFDRVWATPDPLITMIQPYACPHDKARLRDELLADQASDDGGRSYSLCEDGPPDDKLPSE